jgi:Predicted O-methyltransferase
MTDKRPFHFKHFSLYHHRSTMKVGTDAVLLGRWVDVSCNDIVLDIGTGCGIMTLMLAQKGVGAVDAIELDFDSFSEASENFSASQWSSKLHVIQGDVRCYAKRCAERYDLIISNPPFLFIHTSVTKIEKTWQGIRMPQCLLTIWL